MRSLKLTGQEQVLLQKNYKFYRSLAMGTQKPNTDAQRHFVAVCRGNANPQTDHEKVYVKHMRVCAVQRRQQYEDKEAGNDLPEYETGYPRPDWFTDDDWKKLRRQNFADMNQRRREL